MDQKRAGSSPPTLESTGSGWRGSGSRLLEVAPSGRRSVKLETFILCSLRLLPPQRQPSPALPVSPALVKREHTFPQPLSHISISHPDPRTIVG